MCIYGAPAYTTCSHNGATVLISYCAGAGFSPSLDLAHQGVQPLGAAMYTNPCGRVDMQATPFRYVDGACPGCGYWGERGYARAPYGEHDEALWRARRGAEGAGCGSRGGSGFGGCGGGGESWEARRRREEKELDEEFRKSAEILEQKRLRARFGLGFPGHALPRPWWQQAAQVPEVQYERRPNTWEIDREREREERRGTLYRRFS